MKQTIKVYLDRLQDFEDIFFKETASKNNVQITWAWLKFKESAIGVMCDSIFAPPQTLKAVECEHTFGKDRPMSTFAPDYCLKCGVIKE